MNWEYSPAEIATIVSEEGFAWPGGYELFAITDDGGVLCRFCCANERECIEESYPGDGFFITRMASAEMDEDVACDHCGRVIHGLANQA